MDTKTVLVEFMENKIKEFEEQFCFRKVSQSSYDIGGNHRAQEARDFLRQALIECSIVCNQK
jgi:hypothetical protein